MENVNASAEWGRQLPGDLIDRWPRDEEGQLEAPVYLCHRKGLDMGDTMPSGREPLPEDDDFMDDAGSLGEGDDSLDLDDDLSLDDDFADYDEEDSLDDLKLDDDDDIE